MDSEVFHRLKNKITQMAPAIFADNMMMLIMNEYCVSWNPMFTTKEYYKKFFHTSGVDILLVIEDMFESWFGINMTCPVMWHVNEETLSKYLCNLKMQFCRKSDEYVKTFFLFHCAHMIYISLDYYKKGVSSALTIVFFEVYFLASYYSERMNYKCDLVSTTEY